MLKISKKPEATPVYCQNGWLSILSRGQHGNPKDFFDRTEEEMVHPFGTPDEESWLGLQLIYQITKDQDFMAKVELKSADGQFKRAYYGYLKINFRRKLKIQDYMPDISTAGDAWSAHNSMAFNAKDSNGTSNCYTQHKGPNW